MSRNSSPRRIASLFTTPLSTLEDIRLVAAWDMIRQARRPTFFLMRMALAAFISFQIVMIWWGQIEERRWLSETENVALIPINQIVYAIERIFAGSILVMSIGLVLFCPALTSGTIAGDRERKIWHDLANSPLSGWSILMGKMVSRLATLFAWILVAMPLWALLSLVGGLDPLAISLIMLGMFFYGWFYASLGLLASVATRRSRDALGLVTSFVCLLIFVPLILPELLEEVGLAPPWLRDVFEWFLLFDPVMTMPEIPQWIGQPNAARRNAWISLPAFFAVIGLSGPLLTLLAGFLLRPLGRRLDAETQPSEKKHLARATIETPRRQRLIPRLRLAERWPFRLLGEPMIAKERRVRPGSRLTRNIRRLAIVIYLGSSLAILAYNLPAALQDMVNYGLYGLQRSNRDTLQALCLAVSFCTSFILQYGMMLEAAGRIVMEKEQDTWTTLLATPLEPHEILSGKAFGAFWSWRLVLLHLAFIWFFSILVGAMSLLGLAASLVIWTIQLGLMTAVGLRIGMNSNAHATVVSKCVGFFILFQVMIPIMASWFIRDETALLTQQSMMAALAANLGFRNGPDTFARAFGFVVVWQLFQLIATLLILSEVLMTFERKTGRD